MPIIAKTVAPTPVASWLETAKPRHFSNAEIYAFLASAKKADAIYDPIRRCIAFPDPPDSHWSPAAVQAYCRYHLQPTMSFDTVQTLVQSGRTAELEKLLAAALHAQQTQPDAAGLLDRTYYHAFNNGSFDIRPTLDAWKRASPNSAFAFAASGFAYVAMAADARGSDRMRDTPQSHIDAMDRLLTQAETDLQRAIVLNPGMTPAYVGLIHARMLGASHASVVAMGQRALAAAPADYSIYYMLMGAAEPRWGGSLAAMKSLSALARTHASAHPLLTALTPEEPAEEADFSECNCHTAAQLALYPAALDQVASAPTLSAAALAAADSGHPELSVVYFSEALRFDPHQPELRLRRIHDLVNFDESAWAVREATDLIAEAPADTRGLAARAYAYEALGKYPEAEHDYLTLASKNPRSAWPLLQLGDLYVNWEHNWNKGWDASSRIISDFPQAPYGWLLRAQIQQQQPRAGLADTVKYFAAHFDTDPQNHKILLQMRAALALRSAAARQKHAR